MFSFGFFAIFGFKRRRVKRTAHEKQGPKALGVQQNIFFLGLVSLFTDISSGMIYPLLLVFLISILGVGPTFVGLAAPDPVPFGLHSGDHRPDPVDPWGKRKESG